MCELGAASGKRKERPHQEVERRSDHGDLLPDIVKLDSRVEGGVGHRSYMQNWKNAPKRMFLVGGWQIRSAVRPLGIVGLYHMLQQRPSYGGCDLLLLWASGRMASVALRHATGDAGTLVDLHFRHPGSHTYSIFLSVFSI